MREGETDGCYDTDGSAAPVDGHEGPNGRIRVRGFDRVVLLNQTFVRTETCVCVSVCEKVVRVNED